MNTDRVFAQVSLDLKIAKRVAKKIPGLGYIEVSAKNKVGMPREPKEYDQYTIQLFSKSACQVVDDIIGGSLDWQNENPEK